MTERLRWIRHIKQLRGQHGVSLGEAHRIAHADPVWRRWVEHQINNDPACRRMALRHLRNAPDSDFISRDGDRLIVRAARHPRA
jgi:hypothetical protein